jgi:flagellar motility protein MotE (MotC chaperone)
MRVALMITGFLTWTVTAFAAEVAPHGLEAAAPDPQVAVIEPPEDFCANVADKAKDARYVLQMKQVEDARQEVEAGKAALQAEKSEFDAAQKRRKAELEVAQKGVVDIYAKMKPDVAAAQLELIGLETASAILHQLNVRAASTILNEMRPEAAAKISARLAGAAGLAKDKKIR